MANTFGRITCCRGCSNCDQLCSYGSRNRLLFNSDLFNLLCASDREATFYCNPFISELLGYSPLDLLNLQNSLLEKLIHPQDLSRAKQHFINCFNLQDDKYLEIEYRIRDAQGKWH